jgi:hypothetical protein
VIHAQRKEDKNNQQTDDYTKQMSANNFRDIQDYTRIYSESEDAHNIDEHSSQSASSFDKISHASR